MKSKKTLENLILPAISVLCIVLIWAVASKITDSEYILPSVLTTLKATFGVLSSAKFYGALLSTLLRVLIAFSISFVLAFALALLGYKSSKAKKIISPIISIIRALPTIAVVLLLLFWTNSFIAPVIVTILVVLPTIYTGVVNALEGLDKDLIEMCNVFGVSKKQTFLSVQLPAIMPSMLTVIGAGLSLNLKLMVAAEVLSATVKSVGNLLNYASYNGEMAQMLAIVLITVILGVVIEAIFNALSKKAGEWK